MIDESSADQRSKPSARWRHCVTGQTGLLAREALLDASGVLSLAQGMSWLLFVGLTRVLLTITHRRQLKRQCQDLDQPASQRSTATTKQQQQYVLSRLQACRAVSTDRCELTRT